MAKVMIVEDDNSLREIYTDSLQAEGYEVVSAADGEEALATAVKEKPQLIILDVMMPKISGFDVLDILRSTPETKDAKIMMMTALSQQSDKERGERLGADSYLVKSQVTIPDIVANVKRLLEQSPDQSDPEAATATAPTQAPVSEPPITIPDLPIDDGSVSDSVNDSPPPMATAPVNDNTTNDDPQAASTTDTANIATPDPTSTISTTHVFSFHHKIFFEKLVVLSSPTSILKTLF